MLDGMLLGPDALDDFKPLIINNTSILSHDLKKILFSLAFLKNDLKDVLDCGIVDSIFFPILIKNHLMNLLYPCYNSLARFCSLFLWVRMFSFSKRL